MHEVLHRPRLAEPVAATGHSADQMVAHYRRIATLVTLIGSPRRSRVTPMTTPCSPAPSPRRPISS
jgi:hypothetical protein